MSVLLIRMRFISLIIHFWSIDLKQNWFFRWIRIKVLKNWSFSLVFFSWITRAISLSRSSWQKMWLCTSNVNGKRRRKHSSRVSNYVAFFRKEFSTYDKDNFVGVESHFVGIHYFALVNICEYQIGCYILFIRKGHSALGINISG